MDENGKFTSVNDTFNSEAGLVAMKGMQKLAQSESYVSDADSFTNVGAIVTGIWKATEAKEHFGENLGVAKLPTYTVDGKEYQLGSYSGFKLMGIKPQQDAKKGAVLQQLAQFLTNEECQNQRFAQFGWGPSNKNAQATPEVQANASLSALALQGAHGIPQGQIHGSWWDIAKVLGADAKSAKSDADLQASLDTYKDTVYGLLGQTEEQKMAWSVIGGMQNSSWGTDFAMEQVSEGKWQTKEAIEFKVGDEFKLRRGAAWDVQVGADGQMKTPEIEPANLVSEVAGLYHVVLEWDGTSTTAKVTLVPAN
jgi:arabinogalactan oligomer/maltooligosaccharide transport system substrate-binding protein